MDAFHHILLGQPVWLWLSFASVVLTLLVLDLGVLHKDQHEIGIRESLWLSLGYITVAVIFGAWVWHNLGAELGMAYYTAFFVEKSLSLDNVFVISLIFTYFAVPRMYQHRVLFWGILGVLVLRAIMIGLGTALVSQFSWVLYLFGAFLLWSGIKMFSATDHAPDLANNKLITWFKKLVPVTPQFHGDKFWVKQADPKNPQRQIWWATPMFLALIMVESADLVFAVDSVPAVLAITQDPFVVYTSNIFAILGLRALYFALAAMVHRFSYLKYALALVLIFIGGKILGHGLIGPMPAAISLGVTFSLIAGGVLVSLWKTRSDTVG